MIRNIIFDLDNTLIKSNEEDAIIYKEALKKCGFQEEDYMHIYEVYEAYEKARNEKNMFYNRKELLDFLNKNLKRNYTMQFIRETENQIATNWTKVIFITEDILKSLASQYDLYVFTNFFQETQAKRLETAGLLKYFKKVFGADQCGCKPFQKAFENVLKEIGSHPKECVMVGDSKEKDVVGANRSGIKAILFDFDGKRDKKEIKADDYFVIHDFNELEKTLEEINKSGREKWITKI